MGPRDSFAEEFDKRDIPTYHLTASKIRRYFSIQNFIDVPKFLFSIFQSLWQLYFIMPDVVFSKGGTMGNFAVVLAARFYLIPVIVHESDAIPGLTNRFSGKLAQRIGLSFAEASRHFPREKIFMAGNPIRSSLLKNPVDKPIAKKLLGLDPEKPLLTILGGSQGSRRINEFIFENLGALLAKVQVYHQLGEANLNEARPSESDQYKQIGFLNNDNLKKALDATDIVLSRAGAGTIFETAAFGRPAILVPLKESANNHQLANAYEYAEAGAAVVIEEKNFTINLVLNEISNILEDEKTNQAMTQAAKRFSKIDAAEKISREIVILGSGGR
jgi:UDP-N-acetylglucosamine--N-acetylmuramyl-(pentapeptide) pyrophosphoryl-undecaprenol N-acetylglucosamine transferase